MESTPTKNFKEFLNPGLKLWTHWKSLNKLQKNQKVCFNHSLILPILHFTAYVKRLPVGTSAVLKY